MSDALSVYEVTAAVLIWTGSSTRVWEHAFDRLVIIGNSALALAVCAELAQREREGEALSQPPQPAFADLILYRRRGRNAPRTASAPPGTFRQQPARWA